MFILMMLASNTYASEKVSLEEFCKSNPCRNNLNINLKQKDGSIYARTLKLLPPAIQSSFISIYAGETIYIEAKEGKEAPIDLVQVKKNQNPERTIVFKLEQQKEVSDGKSMLLTVKNPFSKAIRYNMGIMPLDQEKLLKTSSCPVKAKLSMFEIWPFPIFQVVVANMHFQKEEDDSSCK